MTFIVGDGQSRVHDADAFVDVGVYANATAGAGVLDPGVPRGSTRVSLAGAVTSVTVEALN